MLKRRLIPKLLIKHRQIGPVVRPVLVTTQRYDQVREVGDPVSQAKIYESNLADELIVLNIDGEPIAGDTMMLSVIERLASETFMPLAVGGGVRGVDDFGLLLEHGADKVTVNRMAVERPDLIGTAAARYGAQCVVVSIDYRRRDGGAPEVFIDHAATPTGLDVLAFARRVAELGAGEILLTAADRDGTGTGIDIETLRAVTDAVRIPVIASGGCGLAAHFTEALAEGRAEGVAAGTFFCFRDQNPMQARAHVRTAGIPIRSET
ncbi:MAG TPA: imidazole glycerol phosphate synthase cyclase subunit [Allosphingosinicella sp.]|nr:imidazole glycerol phosphate synthase cyclase subunit [Allosphingosinicella sp.]